MERSEARGCPGQLRRSVVTSHKRVRFYLLQSQFRVSRNSAAHFWAALAPAYRLLKLRPDA